MRIETSAVADELVKLAADRAKALIARDDTRMDALLSDAFLYTNASGAVLDKAGYIAAYVLDPSVVWRRQHLTLDHLRVIDDVAILVGRVHDQASFGDYDLDMIFHTTQVYRKVDGSWLYVAGHTSVP